MAFRETPSIVWVDEETIALARDIHNSLKFEANPPAVSQFIVMRSWRDQPKIEQYAKATWAAQNNDDVILQNISLDPQMILPEDVIRAFVSSKTVFDRWRGLSATIVVFLVGQVILGILINLVSSLLTSFQ